MKGQCLCEKIKFEFDERDEIAMNCHCSVCRRSHGSAYATQLLSSKKSLKITQGKEYLKEYHSPKGIRAFCSCCGSRLMNYVADNNKYDSDYMSVALSAVVSEHNIKPCNNIFVGSKAPWVDIEINETNYEGYPDDVAKYL